MDSGGYLSRIVILSGRKTIIVSAIINQIISRGEIHMVSPPLFSFWESRSLSQKSLCQKPIGDNQRLLVKELRVCKIAYP